VTSRVSVQVGIKLQSLKSHVPTLRVTPYRSLAGAAACTAGCTSGPRACAAALLGVRSPDTFCGTRCVRCTAVGAMTATRISDSRTIVARSGPVPVSGVGAGDAVAGPDSCGSSHDHGLSFKPDPPSPLSPVSFCSVGLGPAHPASSGCQPRERCAARRNTGAADERCGRSYQARNHPITRSRGRPRHSVSI